MLIHTTYLHLYKKAYINILDIQNASEINVVKLYQLWVTKNKNYA